MSSLNHLCRAACIERVRACVRACVRLLLQISWTLTTQTDTIIDFLLTGKPASLIAMADSANVALPAWSESYFKQQVPLANIVIIDHFETSTIVSVAATSTTFIKA